MWNIWKRRNSKLFWDVYEELHITSSKIVDDLIYFGPTGIQMKLMKGSYGLEHYVVSTICEIVIFP